MPTLTEFKKAYNYHLGDEILSHTDEEDFNNDTRLQPFFEALGLDAPIVDYDKYKKLRKIYDIYLDLLRMYLLQLPTTQIKNILVFESPKDKHFLEIGGNYFRCLVDQNKEINMPEIHNKYQYLLDRLDSYEADLNYYKLNINFKKRIINVILSGIVFIDLMIIPVDLKDKRAKWCVEPEYKIGKKRLTVHLLDFALNHLYIKVKNKVNIHPFAKNCQVAIGTPLNSSVSIFEYYMDKYLVLPGDGTIKVDISRLNSPSAFLKTQAEGTTFPLFKANTVGSGNGPTRALVKNAFNIL
jgi:hypothetical protein